MNNEDKFSPFTEKEFKHILVQAVKGAGIQTAEELKEVMNEAITMKTSSLLLDEVMKENLFMFWSRKQKKVVFDVTHPHNSND